MFPTIPLSRAPGGRRIAAPRALSAATGPRGPTLVPTVTAYARDGPSRAHRPLNRTLIAVALTAALGGCGGSSSDDGDAVAAADPNVDPVPGGTSTADPFEPLDPDAPAPPDGGGSTTPPGDDPGTASGDDSGAASGDGTGTPSGDGSAPDVNADNHVALLGYVFDVFNGSADGYGHDILSLPGHSDPRVAAPPSGSESDVSETERASCGNGGTAGFAPGRRPAVLLLERRRYGARARSSRSGGLSGRAVRARPDVILADVRACIDRTPS